MTILENHEVLRKNNAGLATLMALISGGIAPAAIWQQKNIVLNIYFALFWLLARRFAILTF